MAYEALDNIQSTDPGDPLTAAWCDQVDENFAFLADPPMCSVRNSATQATSHNTLTILSAPDETYDTDAMHSTVTNNSRITVQTAGRYSMEATVNWAVISVTNVPLLLNFLVNGVDGYNVAQIAALNSGSRTTAMSGVRSLALTAGDYVEVRVRQESGFPVAITLEEFRLKWDSL